jgi:hypothetical protein
MGAVGRFTKSVAVGWVERSGTQRLDFVGFCVAAPNLRC